MSEYVRAAFVCQLVLLAYHQATTCFDLFPFNGARNYTRQERAAEMASNAVLMGLAPIGFAFGVRALQVYGAFYYFILFIIELIIWYEDDREKTRASIWEYGKFWFIGLGSFLLAVLLRGLSNTDGPLCINSSAFQFHGVWHILCGLMAIMLYYHWKKAKR